MKRAFLVLLLAGGAAFAYRQLVLEPPVRAFRQFAAAWAREDAPAAAALTTGDAARRAAESRILRGIVLDPMEAFRGARTEIDSRTGAENGDVVIAAREFVFYDPPGVTSAIGGAMVAEVRHAVRMKKTPEGWRVAEWTPTYVSSRSTRPGR